MTTTKTRTRLTVQSEVEKLPRWRRRLAVRVPATYADEVRREYVREFARRSKIKGFRPGKAPPDLVERKYGGEIETEVLKDLVHEGYEAAVEREGLEPIAVPEIGGIRWSADGALEFTAEIDVEPEIELGRTTGFRVQRKVRKVSDEDVERVLERLRAERADWRPVDRPAGDGDRIAFDSVPLDEDGEPREAERVENHEVEIGSSTLLPDFEAGLEGLSPGDRKDLEVGFPDDHPNEALRGRTRTFRVTVDSVKERELPPLDDEFARSLGDFESLAAVREHVRRNLEEEVEQQSRREVDEALIDEIIEANRIELPERLVDRYLANMMTDRRGPLEGRVPQERFDDVRRVLRPGAERALRRYYILRWVAEKERLAPDDGALDAAIRDRVEGTGMSVDEARRRLERAGELDDLRFHLTTERVFEWLREHSKIRAVDSDS